MAIVGPAGSGKQELLQLAAIQNEVVILEFDLKCFGEPLQFVHTFKKAMRAACKLNMPTVVQISETQMRDPIYYDYIMLYMNNVSRGDDLVLFDPQLIADLVEIEAQFIRKMKTVTMPNREKLFQNAAAKVKKNLHQSQILDKNNN